MSSFIDHTGTRFHNLVALNPTQKRQNGAVIWLFLCDCGEKVERNIQSVRSGLTKSCGCRRKKRTAEYGTTHGMSKHPLYRGWNAMLDRCNNPNNPYFKYYGGRGIYVCERWQWFPNFLQDMGERPPGKTIERKDNNGNYEPGNCIWATRLEQSKNRRRRQRQDYSYRPHPINKEQAIERSKRGMQTRRKHLKP